MRFKLRLPMECCLMAATFGLGLGAGQPSLVPAGLSEYLRWDVSHSVEVINLGYSQDQGYS